MINNTFFYINGTNNDSPKKVMNNFKEIEDNKRVRKERLEAFIEEKTKEYKAELKEFKSDIKEYNENTDDKPLFPFKDGILVADMYKTNLK